MLTVENIKLHENVPFDDYVKWDMWSNSKLKSSDSGLSVSIEPTIKMRLGSLVDGILMQPDQVDMKDELYPLAVKTVIAIRDFFGRNITSQFQAQNSYTADIVDSETGIALPVKNRPDWVLSPHFVIDLKCSEANDQDRLYAHMGYENQLWLQSKVAKCNSAFILWANPKTNKVNLRGYDVNGYAVEFWRNAVLEHGSIKTL